MIATSLLGVLSCKETSNQTKVSPEDSLYQKVLVVPPITLKNGRWVYLIEPIETSENLRASGLELVEPSGIKGKVKIRFSDLNALLGSCASSSIKDTIITVNYLTIND